MQLPPFIRTAIIVYFVLPGFIPVASAFPSQKDTVKKDTAEFLYADARFDTADATAYFKSPYGYLISYPQNWERDRRTEDNLVLYLRAPDPKYPATFREMLTIIRESLEDTSKSLSQYVEMQNQINADTWARYKLDLKVEAMQKFTLNGMDAYEVRSTLNKVSQEKLLVIFKQDNYAYKIEYTATNITYDDFLLSVRKAINSFAFVE